MRWQGRPLRGEDGAPPDRAQRNFTDPDSRILPTRDGFVQGSSGQIASAVAARLKQAGRRSRYRLRKQVVEPVFGHIKRAQGLRQFLMRGLDQVRGEWAMICTAPNLLQLVQAGR